jgi:blue copper oxidase
MQVYKTLKTMSMTRKYSRRKVMKGLSASSLVSLGMVRELLNNPVLAQNESFPNSATHIENWNSLRRLEPVKPDGLVLQAAEGITDIGNGVEGTAWLLNGSLPSPFIRVRKGEPFKLQLENRLPDQLILHWHGLTPPAPMDGHPRLSIFKGMSYEYDFTVENRASTYWYHSHSHHRVGKHAYFGIAGMLIVDDDETDAMGLPSGRYEIPLVLQDRRMDFSGTIIPYENPDTMEGLIGNEPFGNGINRPELKVDTALYRFRVLNGSNARIFRLARNDGKKLYIIGNDAGLLEQTATVEYVDIAPGERIDMLVDLRDAGVGDDILLGSRAFFISEGLAKPDDINRQGHPMELMRLLVTKKIRGSSKIPETLLPYRGPDPADAVYERSFVLSSDRDRETRTMMRHMINNKTFRFGRIDERVPFGRTEIWTFKNENNFSHPIHLHATHFRVLSRTGGRNQVMPWERGLKDTVLVHPKEEVRVAVKFEAHPGLFLLHCHNLEHEDTGMMLNIMVEA